MPELFVDFPGPGKLKAFRADHFLQSRS